MVFEVKVLMTILFFLSFLGFMAVFLPPEFQIMNAFDFLWFGGGIVGVAGACVVLTGLPCAVALVIFGAVSLFTYVIVLVSWIKLLIFTPVVIIVVYLVSRLARGGG
jgi:hypothetical protein